MTATHTTFLLYAGDTWLIDAALHDSAGGPLDLAGAAIEWRLRLGSVVKVTLNLADGIVITDAAKGFCRITLAASKSAALSEGSYSDETRVTLADGTVCTQAVGAIVVGVAGAPSTEVAANPCTTVAALRAARLTLLSGGQQIQRVRIEGFEVQYGTTNMADLDRAIAEYDTLCRRQQGKTPRRFAIGSGARSRTY